MNSLATSMNSDGSCRGTHLQPELVDAFVQKGAVNVFVGVGLGDRRGLLGRQLLGGRVLGRNPLAPARGEQGSPGDL